jgi:hypothetical protein
VRSAEHAEKQRRALELRKAGASYDAIAAKVGYANRGGAYKAVAAALAEITAEPAADVKKLEVERLDAQLRRLDRAQRDAKLMADPELVAKVGAVILKVAERRARLLGLDAPVKVQEVPPAKLSDEQLAAELRAELAKLEKRAS